MARLSPPGGNGEPDAAAPEDSLIGAAAAPVEPVIPVDARAVRVRLSATSRIGDEVPIRVTPALRPLRMTNHTVGTGPLGGLAIDDGPPAVPEPSTTASEHPSVDGVPVDARIHPLGRRRFVLEEAGIRVRIVLEAPMPADAGATVREVLVDGFRFDVEVESERIAALRERAARGRGGAVKGGPLQVKAIIPGKVVSVSVEAGDEVTAGQQLLVVEAMKMQNELRSPRDGTIERVGVGVGVNIEVGDLLVVIS